MSRYEFLRNVTIGQYLPTGSVLHQLDPRARLVGLFLLVGAVTLTTSLPGLGIAIAAALLGMVVGRIPARYALRGLLPPLPFLLILAVLQVLFNAGKDSTPLLNLWGLVISGNDILLGVMLILRFFALILVLSLTTFITSTSELTNGLQALLAPLGRLGLPVHDFVLVVQVTLRFIPLLAQSAERIAKAQAARGVEWGVGKGGRPPDIAPAGTAVPHQPAPGGIIGAGDGCPRLRRAYPPHVAGQLPLPSGGCTRGRGCRGVDCGNCAAARGELGHYSDEPCFFPMRI
jgi:energy-coupling factor transport system permease protein